MVIIQSHMQDRQNCYTQADCQHIDLGEAVLSDQKYYMRPLVAIH